MKEVEFKGTDIDEAILNAQSELNLTSDNIEFDIISFGSKGLLGIGKKPAVIKVYLKNEKGISSKESYHHAKAGGQKAKKEKKRFKKDMQEGIERTEKRFDKREDKQAEKRAEKREKREKRAGKHEERKSFSVTGGANTENTKKIADFVTFIVSNLDDGFTVDAGEKENTVYVKIASENTGRIIGKGGRLINSIEYLASKYARKLYEQRVKLMVQVDGDRKKS